MPEHCAALNWLDDNTLVIGDLKFIVTVDEEVYRHQQSNADAFVVVKTRRLIENTLSLIKSPCSRILEFGVWQGGSSVLLDRALQPKRLVAIDSNPQPIAALEEYIDRCDRREAFKAYYGVNQADTARMAEIIAKEFPDGIDLIIDDASHFYEESRASFLLCFPAVVAGGHYVIEDWAWAHWSSELWKQDYFAGKPALTNLLVEICIAAANRPEIVSEVTASSLMIVVTRGEQGMSSAVSDKDPGNLAQFFCSRGMPTEPRL